MRCRFAVLFLLLAVSGCVPRAGDVPRRNALTVSAASSLTEAFTEIGAAYTRANPGEPVTFNFAASGVLVSQIKNGAPVDVFAAAGTGELDAVAQEGKVADSSRVEFAGNRLVLVVPPKSTVAGWGDLKAKGVKHIAIGSPETVPAGRYARETLMHRNLWNALEKKLVLGENVRQVLTYVQSGDAEAGVVFVTDALKAGTKVRIVTKANAGRDHAPIVYPAAVIRGTRREAVARRFVTFLNSPEAQAILAKHGFASLKQPATPKAKTKPKAVASPSPVNP
ncbi:MAG: molybdate ABC transporter substrate-binding protein [Armatimonadetes bacterium]|nr:molybdate ABC transporter substrate-binding protein [Armatimonadota bacterium]